MSIKRSWLPLVTLFSAGLAGCSGGGGDGEDEDNAPPDDVSAAGIWTGTLTPDGTTTSKNINGVAAENGKFAFLVVSDAGGVAMFGTGDTDAFSVTGTGNAFAAAAATLPDGTLTSVLSLTGTVTERSQIVGRYSYGGESGRMLLNYQSSLYDKPSSLATLAGVYTFATVGTLSATITIDNGGVLMLNRSDGCISNGAFRLIDPTANAYEGTWTTSTCGAANGEWTVLGYLVNADGGTNNRLVMFIKAVNGQGWGYVGADK